MAGTLLIDSIVRQTTVLIATLATATGNRPSLAHVANQVLLNLADELKARGIGNKVVADMFGMNEPGCNDACGSGFALAAWGFGHPSTTADAGSP